MKQMSLNSFRATALAALLACMTIGCRQETPVQHRSVRVGGVDRISLRAYAGAPPTIPHETSALSRENCLQCHGEGLQLAAGESAIPSPHAASGPCRQCHVPRRGEVKLRVNNGFRGTPEVPSRGHRAYPGGPPTLPHAVFMRERCLSCHGERGYVQIATPHPDRTNCLQCHVPQQPVAPRVANRFAATP